MDETTNHARIEVRFRALNRRSYREEIMTEKEEKSSSRFRDMATLRSA